MTEFRVSTRQGNNYRLTASTYDPWLQDIRGVISSQSGEVTHVSGETLTEGGQISKLLTVWRTLHVEVDALVSRQPYVDQFTMDILGDWSRLWGNRLRDDTRPFLRPDHPNQDDWTGGNLWVAFHADDFYDVKSNSERDVRVNVRSGQANLRNGQRERDITDHAYGVRDDEISSLDPAGRCGPTPCVADYSLASTLIEQAYLRLEPAVQTAPLNEIDFVMTPGSPNTDRRNLIGNGNYSLPAEIPSSKEYWSIQLISAFDGDSAQDLDPQSEGVNLGVTTIGRVAPGSTFKMKSSVFLETVRDLYEKPPAQIRPRASQPAVPLVLSPDVTRRVTAHEILHTLSLIHDDAIMCGGINVQNVAVGGTITDQHVATIRDLIEPQVILDPNATCP